MELGRNAYECEKVMPMDDAWAKLGVDGSALPLLDHGADVAAVLLQILVEPAWAAKLAACAGRPLHSQDLDRLAALAILHDIGKANWGFWERQFPGKPIVGHTNEAAPLFYARRIAGHATAQRLLGILELWDCPDLFAAAMAHHGRPLEAYAGDAEHDLGSAARSRLNIDNYPAAYWRSSHGYDPLKQLARLLDGVTSRFPAAFDSGPALPCGAPFVSLICGLLTLADWLGSDTTLFPVSGPHGPDREAVRDAAATRAVAGRGLAALATPPCAFATAFGLSGPRGVQLAADRLDVGPVALFEAETGAGKTEAALWRWLALRRAGLVDGLYFALPTRSAAVQLHARVQDMLDRVFGRGTMEAVLAVPGYIRAGDAEGQALPEFAVAWSDGGDHDARWAAERPKRFLTARVAVGTIDQVLMAGLQLRHAHLRAAALSRSLLVVDEVHASDTFMGEVLARVLANHRALGGHALLLSATLTADVRGRLLDRPGAPDLAMACAAPYPALSGSAHEPAAEDKVESVAKSVALKICPVIDDADAIAALAIDAAQAGASVLVVRNSVAGAIAVARAVAAAAPELTFQVNGVATLHHGRFAPGDRRLLDYAVEMALGKHRSTHGRILCGTQTLEQSLDIDADLLITDLAPMDVLLQRIGRLHRHPGRDRGSFSAAETIVLAPVERDLSVYLGRVRDRHGLGPLRDGQGVYPDLLVLEATLRLVEQNPHISIPADNRRLVEGALHPEVLAGLQRALGTDWMNHGHQQDGIAFAERQLARRWALDLSEPFGTLLFPADDAAIGTRLGLGDRLVEFAPSFVGPFGQTIDQLIVPGWMLGDTPAASIPVMGSANEEGTSFQLGERRFRYGQWGLARIDN